MVCCLFSGGMCLTFGIVISSSSSSVCFGISAAYFESFLIVIINSVLFPIKSPVVVAGF